MENGSNEPNLSTPTIRHDGWTGEAMAKFLETLAETGIVLEACDAASKSSTAAYALRRREPPFAEAWEIVTPASEPGSAFTANMETKADAGSSPA